MARRSSLLARNQYRPGPSDGKPQVRNSAPISTIPKDAVQRIASFPVAVALRAGPLIPASLRHDLIREAAYFRAEARGFIPGYETEDWLAAEQDVEELIRRRFGS